MASKTPQFDTALAQYFAKLRLDEKGGEWRACRFSGEKFYVRPEDVEYYKSKKVPLPTLSPKELVRRKLAHIPLFHLFKVKSALTGKEIISDFPPGTAYKIYEHEIWFGEGWDPLEFGAQYDPQRPFFDQYHEFQLRVPRRSLYIDTTSSGSDYTNQSSYLKNCYLVFDSYQAQDSLYSNILINCRECVDGFTLTNCEQCYDCFESQNLYWCRSVEYSKNCIESSFLYDCRDCSYCFMSANLRHKKHYFFNKPLMKEEYEKEIKKLNPGSRNAIADLRKKFADMKERAIYKENHNERSAGSIGDYLKGCKNCRACFYMIECEDMTYSLGGLKNKDCFSLTGGVGTANSYDSSGGNENYNILFSLGCSFSRDIEYCDALENCHDCFGCIGLKNKSFCIFNRQYVEEEYRNTVDEIKARMLEAGEYGEFFPPSTAPIPYNICIGASYRGYDDIETARAYGYRIENIPLSIQQAAGTNAVDAATLPDDIKDIDDSILEKILLDKPHNKQFRIIKQELEFYRRHSIPIPTEHPSIRLENARKKFGSILLELYERPCMKCGKTMRSSYSPDRPETVYCESCYNSEVV